ncbi:hypothetical protein GCM10011505_06500 [Tistrella bauzanensis]|uniref:Uncharacterized protein n=1 Tax=Tistrella bauzanensis TaxID=657419 RepID=A0ABQ1I965_9PROT|nr:hypothetical protein GCM10011505_06500 [Tistrella bauzanensis]
MQIDPHRLGGQRVVADGGQGPADPAGEQVVGGHERDHGDGEGDVVDPPVGIQRQPARHLRAGDIEAGHPARPVFQRVMLQQLGDGYDKGEGGERQIVTLQAQGRQAQGQTRQEGQGGGEQAERGGGCGHRDDFPKE